MSSVTHDTTESDLEVISRMDESYAPYDEDDGKDRKAHIINPSMNLHIWQAGMTSKEVVTAARLERLHIVTLCGYTFIPARDPELYDACGDCLNIAAAIIRELG